MQVAKARLLAWAAVNDVPLVKVEYTVPFLDTDFRLAVWLFYDTDANVVRLGADGTTASLQEEFLGLLADAGYLAEWIDGVSFVVDAHESVAHDYQDS